MLEFVGQGVGVTMLGWITHLSLDCWVLYMLGNLSLITCRFVCCVSFVMSSRFVLIAVACRSTYFMVPNFV